MKKITTILIVLISSIAMGQTPNTIQIIQRVKHMDKSPTYLGSVVISPYYNNYGKGDISAEKLITDFKKKLQENNIPLEKVKEDISGFISLGIDEKGGMLYHYETKIASNLHKFIQLNATGSSKMDYSYRSKIEPEEEGAILAAAIKNARERAEATATKMDAKIGKVVSISSSYAGDAIPRSIFRDTIIGELIFDVTVVFEIME